MKMDDDDRLYTVFLAGDKSALDQLMLKYADALTTYLKGYLYSWEDAEDLMIEAFARILVKKPKIAEHNFKAYLFRVAHNLISHFYKKDRRRKVFSLDSLSEEPGSMTDPDSAETSGLTADKGSQTEPRYNADLYDNFWKDEKTRIIHKCLEQIGEDMSEALWLFYFEEMSYEQIASVMGLSRKKIDNLLSRGKTKLKEELKKEGIADAY